MSGNWNPSILLIVPWTLPRQVCVCLYLSNKIRYIIDLAVDQDEEIDGGTLPEEVWCVQYVSNSHTVSDFTSTSSDWQMAKCGHKVFYLYACAGHALTQKSNINPIHTHTYLLQSINKMCDKN